MTNMKFRILALALAAGLSLSACAGGAGPSAEPTATVHPQLSYPGEFETLKELKDAADGIVVAEVQSTEFADLVAGSVPLSDATLSVRKWLHSSGVRPESEVIVVRQTGGVHEGVLHDVEEDPLFRGGDSVLLFLEWVPEHEVYIVLGGPAGRFTVSGENVAPMPDSPISDADRFTTVDGAMEALSPSS